MAEQEEQMIIEIPYCGVSAEELANTINQMVKAFNEAADIGQEIALIKANPSLSPLQKWWFNRRLRKQK